MLHFQVFLKQVFFFVLCGELKYYKLNKRKIIAGLNLNGSLEEISYVDKKQPRVCLQISHII